jgi:early secretory antigenic target protein ESAT-6
MAATWEGQAAAEYQVTQRKWDTAAADLAAVLAQIGLALGTANESYRQVEQANAARWR